MGPGERQPSYGKGNAVADKDDKTEQPTAKKLQDARKKGQVALSRDVTTVFVLFVAVIILQRSVTYIYNNLTTYMKWIISLVSYDSEMAMSPVVARQFLLTAVKCSLPVLLAVFVAGIIGTGVQTRFNIARENLKPKFDRLNPLSGIKRIFSLRGIMETLKSLLKISILFVMLYTVIKKDLLPIARMSDMDIINATSYMMSMLFDMLIRICVAFAIIAAADFGFQRWQYRRDMMMTKQEVKDEAKMTEGNPEIKGRIRRIQRERAQQRMMQAVPTADVIIRNPTHFAVALKYEPGKVAAPYVVAKGIDHVALRIVDVAEENNVPWIESKELARALYAQCDLGAAIPPEYYGAVAEILVMIYRQQGKTEELV